MRHPLANNVKYDWDKQKVFHRETDSSECVHSSDIEEFIEHLFSLLSCTPVMWAYYRLNGSHALGIVLCYGS